MQKSIGETLVLKLADWGLMILTKCTVEIWDFIWDFRWWGDTATDWSWLFTLRCFQLITFPDSHVNLVCKMAVPFFLQQKFVFSIQTWLALNVTWNNERGILLQNNFHIISAYFKKIIGVCCYWSVYFLNILVDVSKRELHNYLRQRLIRQSGLSSWM